MGYTIKILLLSFSEEDSKKIHSFFSNKLDFNKVQRETLSEESQVYNNEKIKNADIVVINDIGKHFPSAILSKLIQEFPSYKPCFVYYGTLSQELAGKSNVNFANSEFTLYTRIMETLKTQEVLNSR